MTARQWAALPPFSSDTTHSPQPHLNGRHAVLGRVVEGQEVLDTLRQQDRIARVLVEEH
ncbi:MAG: peptidylprolyl isomerase [Armatimonadota bacterium]|nr:peptidylprolyl isomerase [Armatimonadota bacterium]